MKKLIKLSNLLGIESVDIVDNIDEYGIIYFDLKIIDINNSNTYKESLCTLCHELGHWIAYKLLIRKCFNLKLHRYFDEFFADLFGNMIRIFYVFPWNLSRKEYQKFCDSIVR